ncbi:hypothetical protein [Sphingomonas sp. 1P08PE]|uniref:hypothetical protein n=1 Tax=Sphingomonas sp. 1P08PE TaxID=554122 RepID=UPI0039A1E64D
MNCARWSIRFAPAIPILLGAAAAAPARVDPPRQWPLPAADEVDLAAVWPIDRQPAVGDSFDAATRPAPFPLLPLRHCGIADCLRPAPDARFVEPADDAPRLAELLTTLPVATPLDRRHAVIALCALVLTALVWRNRSRRSRATY